MKKNPPKKNAPMLCRLIINIAKAKGLTLGKKKKNGTV